MASNGLTITPAAPSALRRACSSGCGRAVTNTTGIGAVRLTARSRASTDSLQQDPFFIVRSCASGRAALAAAAEWRPDLIVLDVKMPEMDKEPRKHQRDIKNLLKNP